jgi:hypothetical protein
VNTYYLIAAMWLACGLVGAVLWLRDDWPRKDDYHESQLKPGETTKSTDWVGVALMAVFAAALGPVALYLHFKK